MKLSSQGKGIGKIAFPNYQAGYWIGQNKTFTTSQDGVLYIDVFNGSEIQIGKLKLEIGNRGTSYIVKKGQTVYSLYPTYFVPFY